MGQGLPNFLGKEGHEGMQQLQNIREHIAQHLLRLLLGCHILPLQPGLGHFDIPVAIAVPDKVVNLLGGHPQLIAVHILRDLCHHGVQLGEDPLVLQLQLLRQGVLPDGQVHHQEAGGVPNLVGKVAHGLTALGVEAHVVAGGVAGDQIEAQGVRAIFVGNLQGIDAVA